MAQPVLSAEGRFVSRLSPVQWADLEGQRRVDIVCSPSLLVRSAVCAIRPFIEPVWNGSNGSSAVVPRNRRSEAKSQDLNHRKFWVRHSEAPGRLRGAEFWNDAEQRLHDNDAMMRLADQTKPSIRLKSRQLLELSANGQTVAGSVGKDEFVAIQFGDAFEQTPSPGLCSVTLYRLNCPIGLAKN